MCFKLDQIYYNDISMYWLVIHERGLPKMHSTNKESIESTTSNLKLLSGSPDAYEKAYRSSVYLTEVQMTSIIHFFISLRFCV